MTYEQFCEHCDRYQKVNEQSNELYDLGMLRDENPLDDALLGYAEAICDNFGADYGWFLNWISDEILNYSDLGGHEIRIHGRREMYEFLQTDTAKECWM